MPDLRSAMNSKFIPNSFQTPNAYIDQYLAFLTPEEYVVLSYTVRRILGFQLRSSRITVTQYAEGLFDGDRRLDYGTGLSKDAIRKALAALLEFRLLIEIAPAEPHIHIGAEYALQLDSDAVNLPALRLRYDAWRERDQGRTDKARERRQATRPRPLSVGQTPDARGGDSGGSNADHKPPSVGQTPESAVSRTDGHV